MCYYTDMRCSFLFERSNHYGKKKGFKWKSAGKGGKSKEEWHVHVSLDRHIEKQKNDICEHFIGIKRKRT